MPHTCARPHNHAIYISVFNPILKLALQGFDLYSVLEIFNNTCSIPASSRRAIIHTYCFVNPFHQPLQAIPEFRERDPTPNNQIQSWRQRERGRNTMLRTDISELALTRAFRCISEYKLSCARRKRVPRIVLDLKNMRGSKCLARRHPLRESMQQQRGRRSPTLQPQGLGDYLPA